MSTLRRVDKSSKEAQIFGKVAYTFVYVIFL